MYLKQGDYENAVKTLQYAKNTSTPQVSDPLVTISLVSFSSIVMLRCILTLLKDIQLEF